jgi:hypothetical protein
LVSDCRPAEEEMVEKIYLFCLVNHTILPG